MLARESTVKVSMLETAVVSIAFSSPWFSPVPSTPRINLYLAQQLSATTLIQWDSDRSFTFGSSPTKKAANLRPSCDHVQSADVISVQTMNVQICGSPLVDFCTGF